jgi:hypothetical protein
MKPLPIADCRLPITESFSGRRFSRCGHDGRQLVGFFEQGRQFFPRHNSRLDQHFQPQRGFVGFFFNGSDFGDEFGLTARTATGAVIGGDGSSAPQNLFGDDTTGIVALGNFAAHFDDAQSKSFCAGLEFGRVHGTNLQTQSAI